MTNEIKATAPTPQNWIDLVKENERLEKKLKLITKLLMSYMELEKEKQ